MNEWEFKFTRKNTLIFVAAILAGTVASGMFQSPFTGLIIIVGACVYLARKKS